MDTKRTRRKRSTTRKMPAVLTLADIVEVHTWPLGAVKTAMATGENWTDCLVFFDDAIRVGGKFNSRRVRCDGGRFYITYNGGVHRIGGALVYEVLECASHVYGVCKESDKEWNKTLKGY